MNLSVDLNCDLAEYEELTQGAKDAAIMPFISSCNIACGAHAGNQQVIDHTVALAVSNQVNIGAHPSYPDRTHFGRKMMYLPAKELKPMLQEQITVVQASAQFEGTELSHVKPHGALYNQAAVDLDLAILMAEVVAEIDRDLMLYGLAHSTMARAATEVGVQFVAEGFVDRAYTVSKTLQPRGEIGAVINDVNVMLHRVMGLIQSKQLEAVSGEIIEVNVDTLCLHGDHEGSLKTAKTIHQGLLNTGIEIKAPVSKNLKFI